MNVNMARVIAAFKSMLELNGSPAEFALTDGSLFVVQASDVNRLPANLTDGMTQDRITMRVMGDAWHKAAGPFRRPLKGDRVTVAGVKYAVDDARPAQFQGQLVGYVVTLRG